jgi:hypothetical protein
MPVGEYGIEFCYMASNYVIFVMIILQRTALKPSFMPSPLPIVARLPVAGAVWQ